MEKDEYFKKTKPVCETKKAKKSLIKESKNIKVLLKKYKTYPPKDPSNN